ncbi:MAG: acyl-CoA dehydrogenase [Gammaproteobacteria bacterium]
MSILFWFAVFIAAFLTVAYLRARLVVSTAAFAALVAAYTAWAVWGGGWIAMAIVLWAVFLALAIPLNVTALRRRLVSGPVLDIFARIMPEMSSTEQEALEAGTVWWDGDLFSGQPDWKRLLETPAPQLSEEEQAFLDGPTEELCRMLDEWKITHEWGDIPPEAWDFMKKKGFFAMIIPRKYGGLEFSAYAHSQVLVKVASRSATAASTISVPNSLGPAELLLRYGTREQQDHYLPRLADGREVPCFGLTAPKAGSDAGAIPDTGVVCKGKFRGKETVGIRLNWDKRYITLAPIATVLGLAFKLYDPEHLMGDKDEHGITCALIPTDLEGITIGRRHFPLNIPFQNGPTQGKDVFVPLDYIIGGPKMAGQGWRMLVECLSAGRSISLPSNGCGGAKLGVFTTGAYARIRKQFNLPIVKFEGVADVLGRMGGTLYAMDAVRVMTLGAVDMGEIPSVPSAIVKYHVTEMAREVGNDAMDIHGGKGIILGPNNYLGRGYESIPIAITVEGANILTRSMIIFGQGAIRCHPFVLREMHAAHAADRAKALPDFDKALWGHIGLTVSNAVRAMITAATHARFTGVPISGATRRYYQHINRYSAAFALVADAAMLSLGGSLKKKESISARLGDMLSYMYIASAVLKRWEDQGRQQEDLPLVEWACRDMIYKLQEQLHGLLRNFPNRVVAGVLRMIVFPTGRNYSAPGDRLGHRIADLLSKPTGARLRLSRDIYTSDHSDPVGIFHEALDLAVRCEPLEKVIHEAVKDGRIKALDTFEQIDAAEKLELVNAEDAGRLRRLEELTREIIRVDDFAADELGTHPLPETRTEAGHAPPKKKKKKAAARKKAPSTGRGEAPRPAPGS